MKPVIPLLLSVIKIVQLLLIMACLGTFNQIFVYFHGEFLGMAQF